MRANLRNYVEDRIPRLEPSVIYGSRLLQLVLLDSVLHLLFLKKFEGKTFHTWECTNQLLWENPANLMSKLSEFIFLIQYFPSAVDRLSPIPFPLLKNLELLHYCDFTLSNTPCWTGHCHCHRVQERRPSNSAGENWCISFMFSWLFFHQKSQECPSWCKLEWMGQFD